MGDIICEGNGVVVDIGGYTFITKSTAPCCIFELISTVKFLQDNYDCCKYACNL